jgi:hypothetical protein
VVLAVANDGFGQVLDLRERGVLGGGALRRGGARLDCRLAVAVVLGQRLLQILRRNRRRWKVVGVRGQAGRDVVCEAQDVGLA